MSSERFSRLNRMTHILPLYATIPTLHPFVLPKDYYYYRGLVPRRLHHYEICSSRDSVMEFDSGTFPISLEGERDREDEEGQRRRACWQLSEGRMESDPVPYHVMDNHRTSM